MCPKVQPDQAGDTVQHQHSPRRKKRGSSNSRSSSHSTVSPQALSLYDTLTFLMIEAPSQNCKRQHPGSGEAIADSTAQQGGFCTGSHCFDSAGSPLTKASAGTLSKAAAVTLTQTSAMTPMLLQQIQTLQDEGAQEPKQGTKGGAETAAHGYRKVRVHRSPSRARESSGYHKQPSPASSFPTKATAYICWLVLRQDPIHPTLSQSPSCTPCRG